MEAAMEPNLQTVSLSEEQSENSKIIEHFMKLVEQENFEMQDSTWSLNNGPWKQWSQSGAPTWGHG